MKLDKFYVNVKYPQFAEPLKRQVAAIDFRTDTLELYSGKVQELVDAELATPLDAQGRPRKRFSFNLDEGQNVYKQPLSQALATLESIIEGHEAGTESIPHPTYSTAKNVRAQLRKQIAEAVETYPEIYDLIAGEQTPTEQGAASIEYAGKRWYEETATVEDPDDDNPAEVLDVEQPSRFQREVAGIAAACRKAFQILAGGRP